VPGDANAIGPDAPVVFRGGHEPATEFPAEPVTDLPLQEPPLTRLARVRRQQA